MTTVLEPPAGVADVAGVAGAGGAPDAGAATTARVDKLNTASLRRVIEPDLHVVGELGAGALIPPTLQTVADLDLGLSAEQLVRLSRLKEVASVAINGLQFEAILMAGFSLLVAHAPDKADPRVAYMLHEMGEETRHSRLFARMIGQIEPQAVDPFGRAVPSFFFRHGILRVITRRPLLFTLVLAGEEIPDLQQKLIGEHPDTDPFLREVNRYHRAEEARHLAYARLVLPEVWRAAGPVDRFLVRRIAPHIIQGMFDTLIHPGVYRTVGLPGWRTWKTANRSASRVTLRHRATRPIVDALTKAGAIRPGRIPTGWRRLCGVDRDGRPRPGAYGSPTAPDVATAA